MVRLLSVVLAVLALAGLPASAQVQPSAPVASRAYVDTSVASLLAAISGNASAFVVKAPGAPGGQPLATWLTTPTFKATSSPLPVDAYSSYRTTGQAAFVVNSADDSTSYGKERYAAWIAYTGAGTGDPAVIGSHFALGVSSLKRGWEDNGVPGQSIGLNIVARGGYHRKTNDRCASGNVGGVTGCVGPDNGRNWLYAENAVIPDLSPGAPAGAVMFGGYNPAGDVTPIIVNTMVTSSYSQNALIEGVVHYAENGHTDAAHGWKAMNIQLGPMRQKYPDGSAANPGTGISLSASHGQLAYAYQAVNNGRGDTPGFWGGFLQYFRDDGVRAPYFAFQVKGDGETCWSSGAGSTPLKCLRASTSDELQILNAARAVSHQFGGDGSIYMTGGQIVIQGLPVVKPQQPAIADGLTDAQKVAAILARLRDHGLIAR